MPEHNRTRDILIGVMAVAMVVVGTGYYMFKGSINALQVSPSPTSTEEVMSQKQLSNVNPPNLPPRGQLLETSSSEPMTEAQLIKLLQNSSSQPLYDIKLATTTP